MDLFNNIYYFIILLYSINKENVPKIYNESSFYTSWETSIYPTKKPHIQLYSNSLRRIILASAGGEKLELNFQI